MTEMNQYTHRYSLTAADMDTRYRMTPNAVLLYYQDCWARYMACLHLAAFDVVKQNRIWVITEFNAWFEEQTALWSDDADRRVGSCSPKITICTLASPIAHNKNEYSFETASNGYRRDGVGYLV